MFYNPFKKYPLQFHMAEDLKNNLKNFKPDPYDEERWKEENPRFELAQYIYSFCSNSYNSRFIDDIFSLIKVVKFVYNKDFITNDRNKITIHIDAMSDLLKLDDDKISTIEFEVNYDYYKSPVFNIRFSYNNHKVPDDNTIRAISFYYEDIHSIVAISTISGKYFNIQITNGPLLTKRTYKDPSFIYTYYRSTLDLVTVAIQEPYTVRQYSRFYNINYLEDLADSILKKTNALEYSAKLLSNLLAIAVYNGKLVK